MMKNKHDLINFIADFFYSDFKSIEVSMRSNEVDVIKLYELIIADDLIHRRDEFYSLFKRENTADHYWKKIWESERRKIGIVEMRKEKEKYYIVRQYQVDDFGYSINRVVRCVTKNSALALNIYNEAKVERMPGSDKERIMFTELIVEKYDGTDNEVILKDSLI